MKLNQGHAMATGWAGDGAVQDQIDATVKDAIQRARSRLPTGPGRLRCEDCDAAIATVWPWFAALVKTP